MAHPMYEIDGYLNRFPLFDKAVEATEAEVEGNLWSTIGEMGIIDLPKNIIEIIDRNIDGTDAEKQALMIGVLYALSREALTEDQGAFATKYDDETETVLNEVLEHVPDTVASTKISQISAALNVYLLQCTAEMMAHSPEPFPADMIAESRRGTAESEKLFLPNLNAPKLAALYETAKQDFFTVLESAGKPQQAPPRNNFGGPSP